MKKSFLDFCLIFVAIFIIIFVGLMIVTFWKFQSIPDTLVTAVLGTGGIELVISGLIAISKNVFKKEDKNGYISDNETFVPNSDNDERHG